MTSLSIDSPSFIELTLKQEGIQNRIAQVQSFDLYSKESLHAKARITKMGQITVILKKQKSFSKRNENWDYQSFSPVKEVDLSKIGYFGQS